MDVVIQNNVDGMMPDLVSMQQAGGDMGGGGPAGDGAASSSSPGLLESMMAAEDVYEPVDTYNEAFPPLYDPMERSKKDPIQQQNANLGRWSQKMPVRSSTVTQVFHIPVEEQRYKEMHEQRFGTEQTEQAKICHEIMQITGASIEMSLAKDQGLTIVVTGKQDQVVLARRKLVQQLQTQAQVEILIPKEHHRFILGKQGKTKLRLEEETNSKILLPRPDQNIERIIIQGTKEGIEKAHHEIQLISDEQAKLGFERLTIEQCYHPFIRGPDGETAAQLGQQHNVRINIPPPSVHKDEMTIAGEKEGVIKAAQHIMKIYEEKKRKTRTVSVEVRKSQHKYVIGPRRSNLMEILAQTGVSVEMLPLDDPSETITLRGEQDKLGLALNMVYQKANSVVIEEVDAPSWLHKFIIGRKGANIRQITQDLPKTHVEFTDGSEKITLEGPPEEVERARQALEDLVKDMKQRLSFDDIVVEQKYHRHIIGKAGANVTRLKDTHSVIIRIPNDNEHSNVIRIEGNPQGVAKAKAELFEMVSKLENEKSRDILIEQRFHKNVIGNKGEKIRDIREKFNNVMIMLPDPGKKSDVVTLRGPKQDVDKCFKYLQHLNQEMVETNYTIQVPIYKQFHKNVIGKGGTTIKKIKEETSTRIDLPTENSDSDVIVIKGRKADVEKAREKVQAIQDELANITSVDIQIPAKFHNSIIGAKGRLIRSIMEECGNVVIRFPPGASGSDKVNIRGPKDDVERAQKQLLDLSNERQLHSHVVEIRARPDYHRFLIGRGGVNIRKIRDKYNTRVVFPAHNDDEKELITLMGREDDVKKAKAEMEGIIRSLDKIVEQKIRVDQKFHRHFVTRQGQLLNEIRDEYGGVLVSFPRAGNPSEDVTIKGAKECVDGAIKRILEIVSDLESMVTIECVIPQKHHRTVLGSKGMKLQHVCQEFDVNIKFPDRASRDDAPPSPEEGREASPTVNGGDEVEFFNGGEMKSPKKSDIIMISGKAENCERAKEALFALVPIIEEVPVPFEYHRFIIGQKGSNVRQLMDEYDVSINVPAANKKEGVITVIGAPSNVRRARLAIDEKCEELRKEQEDREARSFMVELEVDQKYHPKIIGRKGAVINKIRHDHDVQIQLPERGAPRPDVITIMGYERNAADAKASIMKIVDELEAMVAEEVRVDHRIHSRLIGSKGRNIRKLMDQFRVDIRFPTDQDDNQNMVIVTGLQDDVDEAKDYMLNMEEEYMQDVKEQEYLDSLTKAPSKKNGEVGKGGDKGDGRGFVVRDAPWDRKQQAAPGAGGHQAAFDSQAVPDTDSTTDFPSFGASVSNPATQSMVWGPRK